MVNSLLQVTPKSKIQITNSFGYADGAGAQVQRILSLVAFSKKHELDFVLNPIRKAEIQPIDNLTTHEELQANIDELNSWLHHEFDCKNGNFGINVIEVKNTYDLVTSLLQLVFSRFLTNDNDVVGFSLLDGYFETKSNPETWSLLTKCDSTVKRNSAVSRFVHIHFRLSTFSSSSDRNVPMSYYKNIMKELETEARNKKLDLFFVVHTDFRGNLTDRTLLLEHAVPQSLNYWIALGLLTEDYEVNEGLICHARESLNLLLSEFSNVSFYNEKSWVSQWKAMSSADYLVASKSSFSLIGGIMNHSGIVYVPKSWSLKMPGWRGRD
jgi:hypothetical protein